MNREELNKLKDNKLNNLAIENIAIICHEANRVYCISLGDNSQPIWDDAPQWQKDSIIMGVEYHLDNPEAKPEESHNSWLAEKTEAGWKYGKVKDTEKKEHPNFKPFNELPKEQQYKDVLFKTIVDCLKDIKEIQDYSVQEFATPFTDITGKYDLTCDISPTAYLLIRFEETPLLIVKHNIIEESQPQEQPIQLNFTAKLHIKGLFVDFNKSTLKIDKITIKGNAKETEKYKGFVNNLINMVEATSHNAD